MSADSFAAADAPTGSVLPLLCGRVARFVRPRGALMRRVAGGRGGNTTLAPCIRISDALTTSSDIDSVECDGSRLDAWDDEMGRVEITILLTSSLD